MVPGQRRGSRRVAPTSLLFETPHDVIARGGGPYENEHGVVTQCSHCRRVRRPAGARAWDFVPGYLAEIPDRVSHGLCEPCMGYHYGYSD